jgi:Metallo-peptidase family M12
LTYNGGTSLGASETPGYMGLPLPGPSFAPFAVAAVQYNFAMTDTSGDVPLEPFVFPHEFAHTLGANHNHEDTDNTTPVDKWAFGWWQAHTDGGGDRTIMSYWVDPNCTLPCTRILNYSNHSVVVDWFRTGVAGLDENALTIDATAPATALYRSNIRRIFYDGFQD